MPYQTRAPRPPTPCSRGRVGYSLSWRSSVCASHDVAGLSALGGSYADSSPVPLFRPRIHSARHSGDADLRELSRRSDIWWTPLPLATSLAQSRDRVEIYARGKPLDALLEAGQLRVADQAGSTALGANEITLRFNNWHRVRAERVPSCSSTREPLESGWQSSW